MQAPQFAMDCAVPISEFLFENKECSFVSYTLFIVALIVLQKLICAINTIIIFKFGKSSPPVEYVNQAAQRVKQLS